MCPIPSRLQVCAVVIGLLVAATASAQPQTTYPTPLLKTVYPTGGKVGSLVEVTVDGADLDEAAALHFSHPGLKAERVPDPPVDPKKKNAPPPPTKFKVSVGADTPVGLHDVRVVGKWGISNPRAFAVGELPEAEEKEPNDDVPQAQKVELGAVVNGVIGNRTDVDYFAFAGKKGQRVVAHCAAATIDSRLTAHLQVFTAGGRELGSNRFYRDGDAVVSCLLPDDGDYYVRLCDFAYQTGGSESVYRLTVSAGPWVDAAFPSVVQAGKASEVTLIGRNLPGGEALPGFPGRQKLTVTVNAPATPAPFPGRLLPRAGMVDGFGYRLAGANPVFLALANGPVTLDAGDNDEPERAQPVTLPCNIAGRFEARGDRDYFRFDAKKDDVVVVEGYADRLRGTTDLYLVLRRADNGATVGEFDTHPDVPQRVDRFYTYTDDPLGRVTIPADGTYYLLVAGRDAASRVGPRDVYRVSLRRPQPDFRLVVVGNHDNGAGFTVRRGGAQAVQVVCFRRDGFDGEITLAAEGLPPGVSCEPQVLGPKLEQAALVLSASDGAKDWAGEFRITGTTTIDGKPVVREALVGCLVFPSGNNVPAVSRLARSVCLAVRESGPFRISAAEKELAIPVGGATTFKVKVDKQQNDMKDPVSVTLAAGPAQSNGKTINFGAVNVPPDKDAEVRVAVPSNAPSGRYTLVLRGSGKYTMDDPETKKKRNTQYAAVSAPVVVTVYSEAGELSFGNAPLEVRAGGELAVPVKVKRLYGYSGPITLDIVVPNGSGVSAANATIPAGSSEGKLTLKAAANAKPAKDLSFTVRATAKVENAMLRWETTFVASVSDAAGKPAAPKVDTKATVLLPEAAAGWRYAADVKGDDWKKPDFDDKGWKEVKAPFGNGEAEIGTRKGTEIGDKGQPIYARRAFDVPAELLSRKGVTFRLKVASDNSAAAYLNGKTADEDSGDHEFSYWNRDVEVPAALLKPGKNVVAVRVENTAGSSDVYMDLMLVAEVPGEK